MCRIQAFGLVVDDTLRCSLAVPAKKQQKRVLVVLATLATKPEPSKTHEVVDLTLCFATQTGQGLQDLGEKPRFC